MVVSGVYACQFVLVVKLTAVLKARSGVMAVALAVAVTLSGLAIAEKSGTATV